LRRKKKKLVGWQIKMRKAESIALEPVFLVEFGNKNSFRACFLSFLFYFIFFLFLFIYLFFYFHFSFSNTQWLNHWVNMLR